MLATLPDSFVSAIHAETHDPLPLLVAADWLAECREWRDEELLRLVAEWGYLPALQPVYGYGYGYGDGDGYDYGDGYGSGYGYGHGDGYGHGYGYGHGDGDGDGYGHGDGSGYGDGDGYGDGYE